MLILMILAILSGQSNEDRIDSFRPGQVWLDTRGVPIQAHGGGILVSGESYYWYGEDRTDPTRTTVSCYRSEDLYNWTKLAVVFGPNDLPVELRDRCFVERPKVVFNCNTGRYVLWAHLEQPGYHYSRAVVATAQRPDGPFVFVRAFRPIGHDIGFDPDDPDQQRQFGGTFRDMNVFVDEDGKAYVFYASEGNRTMYVVLLDKDYTALQLPIELGKTWARILVGQFREAPAPFKYKGRYYLITSGCTGWRPNTAQWAFADHILGPWRSMGNPCTGPDAELTFRGQSTFVLPVKDIPGGFIFMADRWQPRRLSESTYIWLPLRIDPQGQVSIAWHHQWDLSILGQD